MANSTPPGPYLGIERIYLRDLSFESPHAPDIFATDWRPQLEIDIQTGSRSLGDERFESVLTLTLEARSNEDVVLVVEMQQAGIFRIRGMDEPTQRRALGVTCPTMLFPYARETLDTLVTKGTFPAFLLAPMNFEALFAESEKRKESGPGESVPTRRTGADYLEATSPSTSRSGPRNRS